MKMGKFWVLRMNDRKIRKNKTHRLTKKRHEDVHNQRKKIREWREKKGVKYEEKNDDIYVYMCVFTRTFSLRVEYFGGINMAYSIWIIIVID